MIIKNSFDKCLNKYDITNLKLLQKSILQSETNTSSIDYQQKTLELYKKQISI